MNRRQWLISVAGLLAGSAGVKASQVYMPVLGAIVPPVLYRVTIITGRLNRNGDVLAQNGLGYCQMEAPLLWTHVAVPPWAGCKLAITPVPGDWEKLMKLDYRVRIQ